LAALLRVAKKGIVELTKMQLQSLAANRNV